MSEAHLEHGLRFEFETYGTRFDPGSYVILRAPGGDRFLGQAIACKSRVRDGNRVCEGYGKLLAKQPARTQEVIGLSGSTSPEVRDLPLSYTIEPTKDSIVSNYFKSENRDRALCDIGKSLRDSNGARVFLNLGRVSGHTFVCGRSGSGKSFALGVLIERLLLSGRGQVVILDFNSEYGFRHVNPLLEVNKTRSLDIAESDYCRISTEFAAILPKVTIATRQDGLRIRFSDLRVEQQASLVSVEAQRDPDDYGCLMGLVSGRRNEKYSVDQVCQWCEESAEGKRLSLRIRNSGIQSWNVWCRDNEPSLSETISSRNWRCLVLDVGSLQEEKERAAVAMCVLQQLWMERESKREVWVIADEAHNLCRHTSDPVQECATHLVRRIAAEGRKFNLHLVLATQKPQKIHSEIAEECENFVLLQMNSSQDLVAAKGSFQGAPEPLVDLIPDFEKGEALAWGAFVPGPVLIKFEGRFLSDRQNLPAC